MSPLDVDNDRAGNRFDQFHADELQLKEHEGRLRHDPNTPGKGPDDHAGHLATDGAGGSPHLDNLVSMLDNVNLREYGGARTELAFGPQRRTTRYCQRRCARYHGCQHGKADAVHRGLHREWTPRTGRHEVGV
ncbi:DNA/RNA non-specific endonuclease [Microbacterium luticocti]|uniref:DNA/RNA non-specific endonuclease n=1 Tax=Microbacterium luticocti TaxID=451764 RepID=UPI003CCBFC6A